MIPLPSDNPIADSRGRTSFPWQRWFEAVKGLLERLDRSVRTGSGTPEAAVTAPVGTIYLRTDGGAGTTMYVKESGSGNTGWSAK